MSYMEKTGVLAGTKTQSKMVERSWSQHQHPVASPSASSSPHKVVKRRGLREKLYSVDSLAETEPEDFDEDDEETESEGSENGDMFPHASRDEIVRHPVEVVLEEDTQADCGAALTSKTLDEDDVHVFLVEESASSVEADIPVLEEKTQVVVSAEHEQEQYESACKQLDTVDDGDDTESEDGDACSSLIDEDNFVKEAQDEPTKLDIFGQSLDNEEKKHEPFLFPPPYFPGDLDEYESDIYETLLRREKIHHVVTDYFHSQPHVTVVMRSMLVDWLVEVHNHFNLQPDTLYLTVNYIDRFLATVPVKRENFQLVALTALLVSHPQCCCCTFSVHS